MISEEYRMSMFVGNWFEKNAHKYDVNKETEDWNAGEECAAYTKMVVTMAKDLNISIELVAEIILKMSLDWGFRELLVDSLWDDYCKGFLAGEILGIPTKENLKKVEEAEYLWGDEKYGYYQEVLEEVIE